MCEFQILPFWNNLKNFTRSLRPSDSLPPVSPPFRRHIAKSDFFIFANSISQDNISTFVDWHFLTWIAHSRQSSLEISNECWIFTWICDQKHVTFLASDFQQYLWFCNRWRERPATFITCICDQKHFCISCLFSPHKFLAALNSVWNIKPVSSEHSIKCWRIQLLQVYKIIWWLCLQCMAKDNYSWQDRGLERCPTLKPCQGCRIKE